MEENKAVEQSTEQTTDGGAGKEKTLVELLNENPKLQSEFDKLNAKSLATAKSKWEKDADAKKSEAEKLARMSADEKSKYELEQAQSKATAFEKELNAYKLKEQATKIAREKGVDSSLLDLIDFGNETAETVSTKLDSISVAFQKAVEAGIRESMKEKTPKTVSGTVKKKQPVSRASY